MTTQTNTIISHLKLSSATFSLSLHGIVIHPDPLTNPSLTNLSKIARKSVSQGDKAWKIVLVDVSDCVIARQSFKTQ